MSGLLGNLPQVTVPLQERAQSLRENWMGGSADENTSIFPQLSWHQRLFGFGACWFLGCVLNLCSFGSMFQLLTGRPVKFAITYTIGNLLTLFSTFFIVGPNKQIQKMGQEHRQTASICYIGSLVITLVLCCVGPFPLRGVVLLICIIAQYISLWWYTLSYIPFGRRTARTMASFVMPMD
jgi:hypothetical protein